MQVVLLRRYEDRSVEALSCSGQPVQKVRLDFGWEGVLEGEGVEGVEMEWNALCYDITVSVLWLYQSAGLAAELCSVSCRQRQEGSFRCICLVAFYLSHDQHVCLLQSCSSDLREADNHTMVQTAHA